MKYIILTIILIFILILWIIYIIRKNRAIKKVNCTSEEKKLSIVNRALEPFGFKLDPLKDIIVSKNDSWQRDLGYMDIYDKKAPFFNMVFDAEPIYFDYNNKHYRLEFWKGQYGITTGAEIGLYIRDFNKAGKEHYRAATDEECLNMELLLADNCYLFNRRKYTWWLTGFIVGKFSKPKNLKLKACIFFPNQEMQVAFVEGLLKAGYTPDKIQICNCSVCFILCCPKNYKLNNCYKIIKCIAQFFNRINCAIYMFLTRFFNNTLDKLTYIKYMCPFLYNLVIKTCVPRRKHRKNI